TRVSASWFDDFERLAPDCRFNKCGHGSEPGCAVQAALRDGTLDPARWANFHKLGVELAAVEAKTTRAAREAERKRLAALQRAYRTTKRNDRGAD
ncbi:MAG: ribosome small subunit-dependent GTPase A, partial [Caulobacteraceae bacterium]|nr:ribosome small subunit-dependent GTPase A [Caulobacteraceae bacterium]